MLKKKYTATASKICNNSISFPLLTKSYILFTVFQEIGVGRGDSLIHETPWTDDLKKPETIQENGIKKPDQLDL